MRKLAATSGTVVEKIGQEMKKNNVLTSTCKKMSPNIKFVGIAMIFTAIALLLLTFVRMSTFTYNSNSRCFDQKESYFILLI